MFERKLGKVLAITGAVLLTGVISLATYVTLALYKVKAESTGNLPGEVGLRSYFHCGDGTQSDPFVITRPIHFRNLARLQNLGAFGKENPLAQTTDSTLSSYDTDKLYHFELGYDFGDGNGRQFYNYADGGSTDGTYSKVLNMKVYGSTDPILSIGSEGSPFYGVFDGKQLEVENLYIASGPEDVGVFGYTNSGSSIKNMVLSNLTVVDQGWGYAGASGSYTGIADLGILVNASVSPSLSYGSSSITTSVPFSSDDDDYASTFSLLAPALTDIGISDCDYSFRSSSEYLIGSDSLSASPGGSMSLSIDSVALLRDFTTVNGIMNTRLSLVGTIFRGGITYSRVLSTYLVTFTHPTETTYGINISAETGTGTDYSHGVNIGFLIGHCDGSASDCYIHGGDLYVNGGGDDTTIVAQESETGLIGEIGCAIDSDFTPQTRYDKAGDTGVVDFDYIYNSIMPSDTSEIYEETDSGGYYYFLPNSGTSNKYFPYLRSDPKGSEHGNTNFRATGGNDMVSFNSAQHIADIPASEGQEQVNLGLGVFALNSSNDDTSTSDKWLKGMDKFALKKEANQFAEFYYTTAEYYDGAYSFDSNNIVKYDTATNHYSNSNISRAWGPGIGKTKFVLGRTLPEYVDDKTWTPDIEKRFNFIFRCNLAETQLAGYNYFSNVSDPFLQAYFTYKLIDKQGKRIEPGSKDFGVMVKSVDPDTGEQTTKTSFDTHLTLTIPNSADDGSDNDFIPTTTVGGTSYPARSISFSIGQDESDPIEYANVTVMASSTDTSGAYVSVYDLDKDFLDSTWNKAGKYANRKPLVSTYIPKYNADEDDFAYFDTSYNSSTGQLDVNHTATLATNGTRLFAHTFKLKKGNYFIASPDASTNIYYVCAQGQGNKGNTGSLPTNYSLLNTIADVDFSAATSGSSWETVKSERSYLSFKSTWGASLSSLNVINEWDAVNSVSKSTFTHGGSSPSSILLDNEYYAHNYLVKYDDNAFMSDRFQEY